MLTVFLNNKLISCDTILPVAMEVHARTGRPVRFITTDRPTYDAIRQNVVLWDAINRIGRLDWLGSGTGLGRWARRLRAAARLTALVVSAWLGRARILHFRALNHPPLDLVARLAPRAVWFCESDSYGESELMRRIVETGYARMRDEVSPRGGNLLAFSHGWTWLHSPATADMGRTVFGPTRTRKVWVDYARSVADRFHRKAGIGDAPETIVFMLGYLGALPYLREADTSRRLLREVLAVLAAEAGGRPVILKPHVITDMAVVGTELARLSPARGQFVVAHLHPSVLAVRARFFIATYYSTTLADAFTMGVPTVEYTDYSDAALSVTGGGSMNPPYVSHFVRRDPARLAQTLRAVLATERREPPQGADGDPGGVLARLAGGTPVASAA